MGAKSLLVLKTHVGSITNISFVNDFVYENMLWAFDSLRVLICNFVVCLFGLILRCISRFVQVGDAKNEVIVQPSQADSEGNGFSEELASVLFWSEDVHEGERETGSSAFVEGSEQREGETECSVFMDSHSDIDEDSEETEIHTECSVLKEVKSEVDEDVVKRGTEVGSDFIESDSGIHGDGKKANEDQTESSVFKENVSGVHHDSKKSEEQEEEEEEEETRESVSVDTDSNIHEDNKKSDEEKTESSVLMESGSRVHEDAKKIDENEAEISVFMESEPNGHDDSKNREEEEEGEEEVEEETKVPFLVETDTTTSTSKCQYMSGKDTICGLIQEPTAMSFSFREFYMGPHVLSVSNNSCTSTEIIADKEFSVLDSGYSVAQEGTENSVPEQVSTPSPADIPFRFDSEVFGGTDSSDEDDDDEFLFNENSLVSDSESESSSSSGLIWGNCSKVDDSIAYQFLGGKSVDGGFESEILKLMMREERTEGVDEKQFPCDEYIEMDPGMEDFKSLNEHGFGGVDFAKAVDKDQKEGAKHEEKGCRNGLKKSEEARWEEGLSESDSEEQDEDDFEWEHDDLVEQLKLELRNARQGGLATILEEEEQEEEEEEEEEEKEEKEKVKEKVNESPKVVEDLEPLKIEEKLEYKDQLDEIEKVYKSYAEKMRKLDILNYQTMHALGLIQLRDPLKLISIPKSTTLGAKPIISQNFWPRKASKNTTDPLLKFVHEFERDLELVYVGQACLSWEILCWQHMKAQELQQYDSQEPHRFNLVAGEFQLFQVLMQRFIENEPFQGPRIQNYVKNRCVIRNLLQVPAIKDDSMKDRNTTKGDEEDPIASGRLADVIKESMRVFWEFIRADKDYGNVILKASQQIGTELKDPSVSVLLEDIRTQLPKKEKRLKDIVRSGNCIVRKFQKHHEDQLDNEQLVAQVGLRLISRVLSMSRLRKEQLIWCHGKLQRINFLSRKIVQVEPSFLLFPC